MGSVGPGPLDPHYRDVRRHRENNAKVAKLHLTVRDNCPAPSHLGKDIENIHSTTPDGKETSCKDLTSIRHREATTYTWDSVPTFHKPPYP